MRFLLVLVLALPAYVVAIWAGMAYARYWGPKPKPS